MANLTVPRMYSDPQGQCCFDRVAMPLTVKEYAPPAAPVEVSGLMGVSNCVFMRIPTRWFGEQHASPRKQLIICLAGAVRFVGSNGASHVLSAGECIVGANTEGPGHTTEVISERSFEGFLIGLD